MRNLNHYDAVFVDIDNTLIYGWWTVVMHYTWEWFHSNLISDFLMDVQNRFNIFKINRKLVMMLSEVYGKRPLYFVTARKECYATREMLNKILGFYPCVFSLATDNPAVDKVQFIFDEFEFRDDLNWKVCLFDDNDEVREYANQYNQIDAFNPTVMFEKLVG